jgi:hypothetical protein
MQRQGNGRQVWGLARCQGDGIQCGAAHGANASRGRTSRLLSTLAVSAALGATLSATSSGSLGAAPMAAPTSGPTAGPTAGPMAGNSNAPEALAWEQGVDFFAAEHGELGAHGDDAAANPRALEPHLRLEVGRSPTRAGFALELFGGAPNGWALLELSGGAHTARELVRLDEDGAARVLRLDHALESPLDVSCTFSGLPADAEPSSGSAAVTGRVRARVQVPGRSAMLAQSRSLAGWGVPNSPFAASSVAGTGLVITEIMKDPTAVSDSAGEWFEVRNLGASPIDLSGWVIRDSGSNSHTIPTTAGAVVPPRAYFIFGINSTSTLNGGVNVGYRYSSFTLGNGADDIQLLDATGLLVDAVAYDDGVFWPDTAGAALNLQRALVDSTLNDDGANWCNSLNPISPTNPDTATPRVANNTCP